MDIDGSGVRQRVVAPHFIEQLVSADHPVWILQEILQETVLLGAQGDYIGTAEKLLPCCVQGKQAELVGGFVPSSVLSMVSVPTKERVHPGQKFLMLKRFCQVVISTDAQSCDSVKGGGPGRGERPDRRQTRGARVLPMAVLPNFSSRSRRA